MVSLCVTSILNILCCRLSQHAGCSSGRRFRPCLCCNTWLPASGASELSFCIPAHYFSGVCPHDHDWLVIEALILFYLNLAPGVRFCLPVDLSSFCEQLWLVWSVETLRIVLVWIWLRLEADFDIIPEYSWASTEFWVLWLADLVSSLSFLHITLTDYCRDIFGVSFEQFSK